MSWGFFTDLTLSMPTEEWGTLVRAAPADYDVPRDWPDGSELAVRFRSDHWSRCRASFDEIVFSEAPQWRDLDGASIRVIRHEGSTTHVRVLTLLDRSQLENAEVLV